VVRASIFVMVLLGGCVAERADEPAPTITIKVERADGATTITPEQDTDPQTDVCALAAALPSDDICSLVCDPDAMASMLLSEGMESGNCYQLRCVLADSFAVQVGVCLPP
jgi:hypothetical protein